MKKMNLTNKIGIIIIIIFLTVVLILRKINNSASPILIAYSKNDSYNLMTKIINESVNDVVLEYLDINDLFIMSYDNQGDLISIDFDSSIINSILTNVSLKIENKINDLNNNIYTIPFGVVLKNNFFSNFGPKIPVKLKLIGSIISNVRTNIKNYGINNALIELYVDVEVNVQVVLPFVSDSIKVTTSIPLALKLIRGNVPEYYANGATDSLISVPIQ